MKVEQGVWQRRISTIGAPIACAAALFGPLVNPVAARPQDLSPVQTTLKECGKFENHVFEACAAYIFNDAHWSLQPYYKYVKSDSIFSGLKNRFKLKYERKARDKIIKMAGISTWTRGTNDVDGPDIDILNAQASLKCGKAVLVTREDWEVTNDKAPKPLYKEFNRIHTVLLSRRADERFRLGDKVLHAWVVSDTYNGRKKIKPSC